MMHRFFALGLLALLLWSGCCETCEKPNLGAFPLQSGTLGWLDFAQGQNVTFRNVDGESLVMTYSLVQRGEQELLTNCEDRGNCGLCCSPYQTEVAQVQLLSQDSRYVFTLTANKDFITRDINQGLATYPDYLELEFNGLIRCELFEVPAEQPIQSVSLAGRTFAEVFACETDPNSAALDRTRVEAFFFKPEVGIVGFREDDGTSWALQ